MPAKNPWWERGLSSLVGLVAVIVLIACNAERRDGALVQAQIADTPVARVADPQPAEPRPPAGAAEASEIDWQRIADRALNALLQEQASEKPALPAVEKLEVKIEGPLDTISGNWVPLAAITKGSPTDYAWKVIAGGSGQQGQPETPGLVENEAKAYFTGGPGDYVIQCAVANAAGQVAMTSMVITLLPQPPENPLTMATIARLTPQTDLSEQHRGWVAETGVQDAGEIRAVAEKLRLVANLLRAGNVADGADPLLLAERAVEQDLSPAGLTRWSSYFSRVRTLASQMQEASALTSEAEFATLFENLAGLLDEAAGRR